MEEEKEENMKACPDREDILSFTEELEELEFNKIHDNSTNMNNQSDAMECKITEECPKQEALPRPTKEFLPVLVDVWNKMSPEIRRAYKLFRDILNDKNKSTIEPFLYAVDATEPGLDDYYEKIKEPIDLFKISDKFHMMEYTSITELAADIRQMIENCFIYNGFDSFISKLAYKLEIILEQKLALLSRELRNKTTIAATNMAKGKDYLNELLFTTHGGKRMSKKPSNGESSLIVLQMQLQDELKERERKRQKDKEKKEFHEAQDEELERWWNEISNSEQMTELSTTWEVPSVGIFIFVLKDFLNLQDLNYTEFELAALFPDKSALMSKIFTSLLVTPFQREKLHRKDPMTYSVWEAKVNSKISSWYKMAYSRGQECAASLFGFDPELFDVLGNASPFENIKYHQLPLKHRMWVMKSLCEAALEQDSSMRDYFADLDFLDRQDLCLGSDGDGFSYHYFTCFGATDIRIYRQKLITEPDVPKVRDHVTFMAKQEPVIKENGVHGESSSNGSASDGLLMLNKDSKLKEKPNSKQAEKTPNVNEEKLATRTSNRIRTRKSLSPETPKTSSTKRERRPKKKSMKEFELIVTDIPSLSSLLETVSRQVNVKGTRKNPEKDLHGTLEALYEELNKREVSLSKCSQKARLKVMLEWRENSKDAHMQNAEDEKTDTCWGSDDEDEDETSSERSKASSINSSRACSPMLLLQSNLSLPSADRRRSSASPQLSPQLVILSKEGRHSRKKLFDVKELFSEFEPSRKKPKFDVIKSPTVPMCSFKTEGVESDPCSTSVNRSSGVSGVQKGEQCHEQRDEKMEGAGKMDNNVCDEVVLYRKEAVRQEEVIRDKEAVADDITTRDISTSTSSILKSALPKSRAIEEHNYQQPKSKKAKKQLRKRRRSDEEQYGLSAEQIAAIIKNRRERIQNEGQGVKKKSKKSESKAYCAYDGLKALADIASQAQQKHSLSPPKHKILKNRFSSPSKKAKINPASNEYQPITNCTGLNASSLSYQPEVSDANPDGQVISSPRLPKKKHVSFAKSTESTPDDKSNVQWRRPNILRKPKTVVAPPSFDHTYTYQTSVEVAKVGAAKTPSSPEKPTLTALNPTSLNNLVDTVAKDGKSTFASNTDLQPGSTLATTTATVDKSISVIPLNPPSNAPVILKKVHSQPSATNTLLGRPIVLLPATKQLLSHPPNQILTHPSKQQLNQPVSLPSSSPTMLQNPVQMLRQPVPVTNKSVFVSNQSVLVSNQQVSIQPQRKIFVKQEGNTCLVTLKEQPTVPHAVSKSDTSKEEPKCPVTTLKSKLHAAALKKRINQRARPDSATLYPAIMSQSQPMVSPQLKQILQNTLKSTSSVLTNINKATIQIVKQMGAASPLDAANKKPKVSSNTQKLTAKLLEKYMPQLVKSPIKPAKPKSNAIKSKPKQQAKPSAVIVSSVDATNESPIAVSPIKTKSVQKQQPKPSVVIVSSVDTTNKPLTVSPIKNKSIQIIKSHRIAPKQVIVSSTNSTEMISAKTSSPIISLPKTNSPKKNLSKTNPAKTSSAKMSSPKPPKVSVVKQRAVTSSTARKMTNYLQIKPATQAQILITPADIAYNAAYQNNVPIAPAPARILHIPTSKPPSTSKSNELRGNELSIKPATSQILFIPQLMKGNPSTMQPPAPGSAKGLVRVISTPQAGTSIRPAQPVSKSIAVSCFADFCLQQASVEPAKGLSHVRVVSTQLTSATVQPLKPSQPAQQVKSTKHTQQLIPVQLVQQAPSAQLAQQTQQTQPVQPVQLVEQAQLAQKTQSVQLVQQAQPAQFAQQNQPVQPVQLVQQAQLAQKTQQLQLVQQAKPAQFAQQTQPIQPLQLVQQAQLAQKTQPVQLVQQAQPAQLAQQTQPVQPLQQAQSAQAFQQAPLGQPAQLGQRGRGIVSISKQPSKSKPCLPNNHAYSPVPKSPIILQGVQTSSVSIIKTTSAANLPILSLMKSTPQTSVSLKTLPPLPIISTTRTVSASDVSAKSVNMVISDENTTQRSKITPVSSKEVSNTPLDNSAVTFSLTAPIPHAEISSVQDIPISVVRQSQDSKPKPTNSVALVG